MFGKLDVIMPIEALDGPMQMALDEVLLLRVERPTLRCYRWDEPWATFGYFQSHRLVRELHPSLPLVRRCTGGGIVVHGEDLTFSLMIPPGNSISAMAPALFYHELHGAIASIYGGRLAGRAEVLNGPSCFSAPSMNDLMDGERKVLGGALRRSRGSLLYQGSMLNDPGSMELDILARGLCKNYCTRTLGINEMKDAQRLAECRYASSLWNERR
jgi:lipoyl(octanoyl) transferase